MAEKQEFSLSYEGFRKEQEPLREALCTLGNGYFATRGAHESTDAGDVHYPGTYLAAGYDRAKSNVKDKIIENEDLVNWPNWQVLKFRPHGEQEWYAPERVHLLEYRQKLDMENGVLVRESRFRDFQGRETSLVSRKLVHMRHRHYAAIQWTFRLENWDGLVDVLSAIDGGVENSGVARYRELNGVHLAPITTDRVAEDAVVLEVKTRQSDIHMAQAMRTRVFHGNEPAAVEREPVGNENYIGQLMTVSCSRQQPVRIQKIVSVYTSRDPAMADPLTTASENAVHAPSFEELLECQVSAWKELWDRCDIRIGNDGNAQKIARLHIFHLLQTASMNTTDQDTGVPPRGWHGEAYRGHIMWDELFILPFYTYRIPELTRALLNYRYRRLERSRRAAREAGYRGAMFPWQSGSDGREESQDIHLNPQSGRWIPDNTHLQRHVNSAIVYSVWQYFQITDDREFLYFYGAELILSIAQFWASKADYNPDSDRFGIRRVVGPDEYHTSYPKEDTPGINNNAYTNITTAWVLARAREVLDILDGQRCAEICSDLGITREDLDRWDRISRNMYVPFLDNGVIAQFDGYDSLEELDWEKYRSRYGDNIRLDRVLEAENDSVNRYKAGKQADVLMLFYLFSAEEIADLLRRMGYEYTSDLIPRTLEYYGARTSHGSTLSRIVYSWVLSRFDRAGSWDIFEAALQSDTRDVQGGTTPEGIHLGAMAGTVDMLQRCYTGMEVRDDILILNPRLPDAIGDLTFRLRYRSRWVNLTIDHKRVQVEVFEGWGNPITVRVCGQEHRFDKKEKMEFSITSK